LIESVDETDKKGGGLPLSYSRDDLARRGINKRSIVEPVNPVSTESMDVDEPSTGEDATKRASKRKM